MAKYIKISLISIIAVMTFCLNTGNAQDAGKSDLPESWVNPPPDKNSPFPVHTFVTSKRAPLVSVGVDGLLIYMPYSNKGDRILNWSHCGYKQSEVPIPDVPVVETLHPSQDEAIPFGNMCYPKGSDSREVIQAALDRVDARENNLEGLKGTVLLKKGTYYVYGSLKMGSGVVLRGEGDGKDGTVLIFNKTDEGNAIVIQGDGPITEDAKSIKVRIAQDYVPSGGISLNVEVPKPFKVGDFVCIVKTVNEKWIADLGMGERLRHIRGGKEGAKKSPWKPNSYQFEHIRQIKAISGNTITLDMELPQSFEKQHGGGELYKVNLDELGKQSGVEHLCIVSNYDTTVTSNNKSTNFHNFSSGIVLANVSNSWVRNCTMLHFSKSSVMIGKNTRNITVRDCKSLKPIGPYGGGFRYPFFINGGTGHLVYQCYTEDARHDFVGGARTMGPSAFVKCIAVRGGTSEPHHRWGTGYLFDCIKTDGSIGAFNRGDSGSGHGWAASNTLVWNADAKSVTVFDPETTGENNFAIGFTGKFQKDAYDPIQLWYANTRPGYWGTPQEGKYYGYALMGSGYIENPGKPVEPTSLFIQQLIDRIGEKQAMKVLQ